MAGGLVSAARGRVMRALAGCMALAALLAGCGKSSDPDPHGNGTGGAGGQGGVMLPEAGDAGAGGGGSLEAAPLYDVVKMAQRSLTGCRSREFSDGCTHAHGPMARRCRAHARLGSAESLPRRKGIGAIRCLGGRLLPYLRPEFRCRTASVRGLCGRPDVGWQRSRRGKPNRDREMAALQIRQRSDSTCRVERWARQAAR
jgi:hypothetical protein